jgi:uncharacterized membrane protein
MTPSGPQVVTAERTAQGPTARPAFLDGLVPLGRLFFAIGLAGFGVLHVVTGDFVAGRAPPWPEVLPGRDAWAFGSGIILIGVGVAIVTGRRARLAAVIAGTMILAWALLRHLPLLFGDPLLSPQWTQTGKALVFFGGSFTIAGSLPLDQARGTLASFINTTGPFLHLGRVTLALFLILCGIQHFMFDRFVASLVPAWIPGPFFWTYFAGVALIAGGAGLLLPRTARLAAALSGLMIFSWVWLVHYPRITSHGEWTSPFEALALSGLAFLLSRRLPRR